MYIHIITFGCQMNLYDSSKMTVLMRQRGYEWTDDPSKADLVLVNSCCIREKAEQKFFSQIGRLQRIKEKNPLFRIGICGCVAQREKEYLFQLMPGVDLVFGTLNIDRLPTLIEKLERHHKKVCEVLNEPVPFHYNGTSSSPIGFNPGSRISAWVTIMEGCNNFCSYCVVPYVRGSERSRPPEHILDHIKSLVDCGCKEITLLGQNVNSYGVGLSPMINFSELLYRVNKIEGLSRIRFTTSHPKDFSYELIEAIRECDKVCEHVHLPLQSGSDKILFRMNRGYSAAEYIEKVNALKAAIPETSLTGDMIVGFPSEKDNDFHNTIEVMKKIRFDGLFSFKYSKRPQTEASAYEGQVPEEVKLERLRILQNLQNQISLEKNMELTGKTAPVLVEGTSKKDPTKLFGRTRSNKIVNFAGNSSLIGTICNVSITRAKPFDLIGEMS
ncbi:MAG: tRNA (N6-isopentenyl adenosine(37)-C2)-methylthiotransferase MiaB [bacterium]